MSKSAAELNRLAIVILAAGASSRMGDAGPKQLLPSGRAGMSLLQNAVNAARDFVRMRSVNGDTIFVVLGANAEKISAATDLARCTVLVNGNWASGMSSSIRAGVSAASEGDFSGCLILVADQPLLDVDSLEALLTCRKNSDAKIVVSTFAAAESGEKLSGPPVFFAAEFFAELQKLDGDAGARKVVNAHRELVETVEFAGGALDVDTQLDHQRICL